MRAPTNPGRLCTTQNFLTRREPVRKLSWGIRCYLSISGYRLGLTTMTSKFKVAAVHASSVFLDQRGSIEKACGLIEEAGRQDIKVLVFPESFVPGFPYWINLYPPTHQLFMHKRFGELSVVVPGPDLEPVQAAAKAAGVYVVLGASERDGGTLYNTQVFQNAAPEKAAAVWPEGNEALPLC